MTRKPARPKRQTITMLQSASSQPTSPPGTATIVASTGPLSSLVLSGVGRAVLCEGAGR